MKTILLMITMFLSGCGGTIPLPGNCDTTSGITVCSEGPVDLSEIDTMVETLERKTQEVYPSITNISDAFAERGVNAQLIKDKLAMGCEEIEYGIYRCDKHIGGAAINGKVIYVEYHKCLAWSAFAHELLHAIEYAYLGGSEGDHDAEKMFNQGAERQGISYQDTIEWKTNFELFYVVEGCAEFR